jgi:transcriptional regulator with PAS, ATPase and Fis domain
VHADGGTLFLDEIGELPMFLQAKLLRVLESMRVRPVGADDEISVDVRIVAATNRHLAGMVEDGRFRDDLYYRLNVLSVRMPPLRERPEDIAGLIDHFSRQLSAVFALPAIAPTRAGLRRMQSHAWPGNVRELKNLIERAILLGKPPESCLRLEPVEPDALQARGTSGYPPDLPLGEVKRRHMARVLATCNGNKSEAARRMGVSRKTLERWLREGAGED